MHPLTPFWICDISHPLPLICSTRFLSLCLWGAVGATRCQRSRGPTTLHGSDPARLSPLSSSGQFQTAQLWARERTTPPREPRESGATCSSSCSQRGPLPCIRGGGLGPTVRGSGGHREAGLPSSKAGLHGGQSAAPPPPLLPFPGPSLLARPVQGRDSGKRQSRLLGTMRGGEGVGAGLSSPRVTLWGEPEGGVIRGLTWEMRQPR